MQMHIIERGNAKMLTVVYIKCIDSLFHNCCSPTLCNPMDCGLPGSCVHESLQAGRLGRVAISYSRGSSWSSIVAVVVLFNFISKMSQICYRSLGASLVVQMVKNLPVMQVTQVWSLGWEDPLEKEMATHSSILAWRIAMDRGAWWATVHGVVKSQTWLSD